MTERVRAILQPTSWWECFVCGETTLCHHREPELIAWMRTAPSLAEIAASRPPERIAPAREIAAASGSGQLELFALPERRRA
jgi:hypothetical protein